MKSKFYYLLLTALCGLFGMNVWAQDLNTTYIDGVEYYEIGNADDLVIFAQIVNGGETTANAVLTSDIDMSTLDSWTAIGDWNTGAVTSAYCGHFDGQGHTITGFNFTSNKNYFGIFGVISTGALIENFSVSGTITTNIATAGVVGYARDATPTIRNIHSYLNINNTRVGSRLGGILGSSVNGTIVVENCTYSGTLDGNDGAGNGNYGGIVGYVNNNANAHLRVTNCLFDGELINSAATPGDCTFGGMVGYVGANPDVTLTNCLSIGTLQSAVTGQFYGAVKKAACSIVNSFYQGDNINGSSSTVTPTTQEVTKVTNEQLASGEICYLLNESVSGGTNWFQTLNDDDYPFPYNGGVHDPIYANGNYYCDGVTPKGTTTYGNTDASTIDEHTLSDGICSVCGIMIDEYYMEPNAEEFYEIGTPAQLRWFAAYVNQVDHSANAVLTANLDMTDVEVAIIGNTPSNAFRGIFDGQGYEINNYSLTYNGTLNKSYGYGMFGNTNGATIKNFTIDGSMTFEGNSPGDLGCGLVGWPDGGTLIQGIKSSINIDSHVYSHIGGIVGSLRTATVDRCEYAGTLNGYASTNGASGIAGYTNTGTITNCIFSGTLEGTGTGYFGGILGYVNNVDATVKNCLSYGQNLNTASTYATALVARLRNIGTYSNNYYVNGKGVAGEISTGDLAVANTIKITTEQLANGEACYLLNGDQSEIVFFQTLPDDEVPTFDDTHETVYAAGTTCPNGHPQGVTYSNTPGGAVVVKPHVFVDGFCTYCEVIDEDYIIPNSDDFLEIGTPAQLKWLAIYVNQVDPASNAVLTADIDLTGVTLPSIGNSSVAYAGEFDGQGYAISNFKATSEGYGGFFGMTNGATIKNFSIGGTLTVTAGTGSGVVGWAENSTISNIQSALVIEVPNSGAHHTGGVVGSGRGTNVIDRCSFSGSMTIAAGSTDNFAGVVAYITHTSTTRDVVTNCANYGDITFSDAGCAAGGVLGYLNSPNAIVSNCLNTGSVTFVGEGSPKFGGAILGRTKNTDFTKITNNFWLEGSANGASKKDDGSDPVATGSVTAEQLASGEVAYKLGEAWSQIIRTDDIPALGTDAPVFYVGEAGYATLYDTTTGYEFNGDVTASVAVLTNTWLELTEIEKVPAGTPVILMGTYFNKTAADLPAIDIANDLKGTDVATEADGTMYVLAKPAEKEVGFYKATGTIPAGKAYFQSTADVKAFFFAGDATGIEETLSNSPLKGENVYNLAGQRMGKMHKGINIVDGKKILK